MEDQTTRSKNKKPEAVADSIIDIQISLNNNTGYTLVLDTQNSSGIDTSVWPQTIGPNTEVTPFTQSGTFQVKFDAWYFLQDATGEVDFNGYWTAGWEHDCKIKTNPDGMFSSSTTSYTNSSGTYNLDGSA